MSRYGYAIDTYERAKNDAKALRGYATARRAYKEGVSVGDAAWLYATLKTSKGIHNTVSFTLETSWDLSDEACKALGAALSKHITEAAFDASDAEDARADKMKAQVIADAERVLEKVRSLP